MMIILAIFFVIMLILILIKPDILISKKIKSLANDEQLKELITNLKKTYSIGCATIIGILLFDFSTILSLIIVIPMLILLFTVGLPASKKASNILKELGIKN